MANRSARILRGKATRSSIPPDVLAALRAEHDRAGRSLVWLVTMAQAWREMENVSPDEKKE